MSSYWSNLVFKTGSSSMLSGTGYTWVDSSSPVSGVKFISRAASKSVAARVAQQTAMQQAAFETNRLFSRLQRDAAKKLRDVNLVKENNFADLIKGGEKTSDKNGTYDTSDNAGTVVARDYKGRKVTEALIMAYVGDKTLEYTFPRYLVSESYRIKNRTVLQSMMDSNHIIDHQTEWSDTTDTKISTKDVIHIDLSPQISLSTSKNLVLTTVQGRDYSRKELISNGDMTFNINGSVVSNTPGVYPSEAVNRLIKLAQYKGIIKVRHFLFDQMNVKHVIIKDFNLGSQEFKNIQPYTISCIAIEADEIQLQNDTIGVINQIMADDNNNSEWWQLLLHNKLTELAATQTVKAATTAVAKGLDVESLIKNI